MTSSHATAETAGTCLETVIPVPKSKMRLQAICPNCGTTMIGFETRTAIETVAALHDQECAHLTAARELLTPQEDAPDELAKAESALRIEGSIGSSRIRRATA